MSVSSSPRASEQAVFRGREGREREGHTRHAYARIYISGNEGRLRLVLQPVILGRVLTSNMRPVQRLYRSSPRRHHPRAFPLRECLHPAASSTSPRSIFSVFASTGDISYARRTLLRDTLIHSSCKTRVARAMTLLYL